MAVGDELAGFLPAAPQAQAVDEVVEPGLQELQQLSAGDALGARRLLEVPLELRLKDAVEPTQPLFLPEAHREVRRLPPARPVHPRGRRVFGHRAFVGVALLRFQVQFHALSAAEPADGLVVPSHEPSFTPAAAWAAGIHCAEWA